MPDGWAVEIEGGDVVDSAPALARLTLNVAMAHLDAGRPATGAGSSTAGTRSGSPPAQATRALPALVTILGWHACDHTAPVFEGDTLRSRIELERREPLPGGGGLAAPALARQRRARRRRRRTPTCSTGASWRCWRDATQPLAGLRVIEGSAFVAAPLGGMTLAQLGADVIRFDQIGGGLDFNRWPLAPSGESLFWAGLNKGKRSIQVDLRSPEGRELVERAGRRAGPGGGILLTNFPARGWLAYDALRERRADLIMCALTGNPDGSSRGRLHRQPGDRLPVGDRPARPRRARSTRVLPAWDVDDGRRSPRPGSSPPSATARAPARAS